jgi:hypothetical protein
MTTSNPDTKPPRRAVPRRRTEARNFSNAPRQSVVFRSVFPKLTRRDSAAGASSTQKRNLKDRSHQGTGKTFTVSRSVGELSL